MPAGAAGPSHRLMAALDVGMVLLYVDLNPVTARRLRLGFLMAPHRSKETSCLPVLLARRTG